MKRSGFVLLLSVLGSIGIAQSPQLPTKLPALPESAKAAKELEPFRFLVGRWIGVNPNGSVNEEHWTAPRGTSMVATFRQIRRDGKLGFVEVSSLSVEKDGVRLRLRHLHGGLEIPKSREESNDFAVKSLSKDRVEFTGVGKDKAVTAVIYRLDGKDRMIVETQFAPETGERGYQLVYFREKN